MRGDPSQKSVPDLAVFDAEAVSRAESLGVIARSIVEGYRVGAHRSPFQGFALEFAQHREYAPGDDPKHLDWKLFGRTDRFYLKQYEQDTNFVASLLIDASASMGFGSGRLTKLHFAKVCAAALAHAVLLQKDAVAVNAFDEGARWTIPRTDNVGTMHEILRRLADLRPDGGTSLSEVIRRTALTVRRRGIVVLFSDFFDEESRLEDGLKQLRYLRHDVILFHVLDALELTFDLRGAYAFVGMEGGGTVTLSAEDFRDSYLAAFREFRGRIKLMAERLGCHYVLADTSHSVAEVLGGYLSLRRRLRRGT